MLTAGFEPAHANIPGPKPGSLDHSDKSTVKFIMYAVGFEPTWSFRSSGLEPDRPDYGK